VTAIDVREITAVDELESMRDEWKALLKDSNQATVFSTWEWQYAAAKHLVDTGRLCILAASLEGDLIGILPLVQRKIRIGGLIPSYAVVCLGGAVTDYNPLLVRRNFLSRVIPALASHLEQAGLPVALENVLPGSPLDILGRFLRNSGFHSAVYETKLALATRMEGTYKDFLKSRKSKFKRAMNNNRNYMDRTGGYTYHAEYPSQELLEKLIELHTSRWIHKGEAGALARRKIQDFHTELHNLKPDDFEIRYYTIQHNDKIVAIIYGFLHRNRFYAYLSGLDMAHSRISPGNMVFEFCMQRLYDENVAVFDMLRGDMKYKQSWATASYDMADTIYFPRTVSGRMLHANLKTLQAIKKVVPPGIKSRLRSALPGQNK
jgi:CelD/BcsL family acetyltransferase involved in cellulose biosynthesis